MEVSGQLHVPATLRHRERAIGTHWIGNWMGLRIALDAVEKREFS
jgi:hypothetical protein